MVTWSELKFEKNKVLYVAINSFWDTFDIDIDYICRLDKKKSLEYIALESSKNIRKNLFYPIRVKYKEYINNHPKRVSEFQYQGNERLVSVLYT